MPKKKSTTSNKPKVKVGNISKVRGNVNIAGSDIVSHKTGNTITGLSGKEIKALFDQLYAAIETRLETSPAVKEDLKADVKDIQDTVTKAAKKNEKVDEGFLARRFRNIARIAPDILEMAVTTLGGPLAGLGVAAKLIAEKAKEEIKAG